MHVSEVMTRRVLTVPARGALSQALEVLWFAGVRHLPVVDGGEVVGIVSRRTLLRRLVVDGGATALEAPITEVAVPLVATAAPDEDVDAVARRMVTRGLGCLPVLDGPDLVGIVTTSDLLGRYLPAPGIEGTGPRVAEVMHRDPIVAHPGDPLLDAVAKMSAAAVRHLPVVDGEGILVGMLTDRDARTAVGDPIRALGDAAPRAEIEALEVGEVMTREVVSVDAGARLSAVAFALTAWRYGAVPVVDPDGRLLGIVSYVDVLHHARL